MSKRVLGLDLGANSIGFSLLELEENDNQISFNEIVSNSIVFSEPNSAEDRRNFRSGRRLNERKSARKKFVRKLFVKYGIADKKFIENPTSYLNSLNITNLDVYDIRQKAVSTQNISKEEFILSVYSILTDRGYNNMFSISKEDGAINEAVTQNKKEYLQKGYILPSKVLTQKRDELKEIFQNIPVRNKKDDYSNSLDRELHKEEFKKVVESQCDNKSIFTSQEECKRFIDELLDEETVNTPFYQRTLKSFEDMVAYCSFYHKYNPKGCEKRVPLANIRNIELTLRQKIDNYEIVDKNGELHSLSKDEIAKVIAFWIDTPNANEITAKNLLKNPLKKDLKLNIPDKVSQVVLNIESHRKMLEVLNKYDIDFKVKDNSFYNEILLELYYFKNKSSRIEHISKIVNKYNLNLKDDFLDEVSSLDGMDGFGSFSLRFINEILELMKNQNKTYYEATNTLGYDSLYVGMPKYDYLPPLEPTEHDIKWLKDNLSYFKKEHIFYQPMISPKVKRVLSILRKLVNELITKYGQIDEIRIESAKELNSSTEEKQIKENQNKNKTKNDNAVKFLEANNIQVSKKNIERAKLFIEQGKDGCLCLYSGEPITKDEAFDENETEIEHFIPRSVIWINSFKNKILVKKKANQDKSSKHPISFLNSKGQWEGFKGRVQNSFMDKKKKEWLNDENIINSVMQKEHWQESFLNDTRTATKTIAKYLNHYLYPIQKEHNKDGERHIFSVSGKAISELKYIWGISEIMPKNEDDKKDRNTNYHHTLDAFSVALCGNSAINTLHGYFKQKENKFKIKAQKEKISSNLPISKEGINIVEYLKNMVQKYEENKLYVCPYNKRKTNMKGFKDGNLKLYIADDPKNKDKKILAEMEKIYIDKSLLIKKVNGFDKDRNDSEVVKEIESIQSRLNPQKQKMIIPAIKTYADELLKLRNELKSLEKEIKPLDEKKKVSKAKQEENIELDNQIKELKLKKQNILKAMESLKCSFPTKKGKRQIVSVLNLYKTKIEQSKADAIIFPNRKNNKIERLTIDTLNQAIDSKEPFVLKANESTLNIQLFNTEERGQVVGLNYFSSLANNFSTKINERYKDEKLNYNSCLTLYKNDIIKIHNTKELQDKYFIFNGGGNVTGSNNKLTIKNINKNSFNKVNRKGETNSIKEDNISPGAGIIVSKVNIDFFGNIREA